MANRPHFVGNTIRKIKPLNCHNLKTQMDRVDNKNSIIISKTGTHYIKENDPFIRNLDRYLHSNNLMGGNVISRIREIKDGINLRLYDDSNSVTKINVSDLESVNKLKLILARKLDLKTADNIKMYYRNSELLSSRSIREYELGDNSNLYFTAQRQKPINSNPETSQKIQVKLFGTTPKSSRSKKLIRKLQRELRRGTIPEFSMEGTSGTYVFKDKNRKRFAIFKPSDEEPNASNNPRTYIADTGSPGIKPGLRSGCGANREVAAYLLDRGFAGVPHTTMAEFINCPWFHYNGVIGPTDSTKQSSSKIGSLQEYIPDCESCADFGTGRFETEQVHRIGILDLHILNLDRNEENLLVRNLDKNNRLFEFIPIDHGYCLPDCLAVEWYDWVWLNWPQTRKPFSKTSLDHISSIDITKSVELLRGIAIDEESIAIFIIANTILKSGAKSGLTLYQIAKIILRAQKQMSSILESVVIYSLIVTLEEEKIINQSARAHSKSLPVGLMPDLSVIKTKSESLSDNQNQNNFQNGAQKGEEKSNNVKMDNYGGKRLRLRRSRSMDDFQRPLRLRSDDYKGMSNLLLSNEKICGIISSLEMPKKFIERAWRTKFAAIASGNIFVENLTWYAQFITLAARNF